MKYNDSLAWYYRAKELNQIGFHKEALSCLNTFLVGNEHVLRITGFYERAKARHKEYNMELHKEILEDLKKFIAQNGQLKTKEDNQLELYEKALTDLDKILAGNEHKQILRYRVMAFYEKAEALKGLNCHKEAQEAINQAQVLIPDFKP